MGCSRYPGIVRDDGLVFRYAKRDLPTDPHGFHQPREYRRQRVFYPCAGHGGRWRCAGNPDRAVFGFCAGDHPLVCEIRLPGQRDQLQSLAAGGKAETLPDHQPRHFHPHFLSHLRLRIFLQPVVGARRNHAGRQCDPLAVFKLDVVWHRWFCIRIGEPGGEIQGRRR